MCFRWQYLSLSGVALKFAGNLKVRSEKLSISETYVNLASNCLNVIRRSCFLSHAFLLQLWQVFHSQCIQIRIMHLGKFECATVKGMRQPCHAKILKGRATGEVKPSQCLGDKLTLKLYTDGIVFNECVFWILKISKLCSPSVGTDWMDVLDKSLRENIKLNENKLLFSFRAIGSRILTIPLYWTRQMPWGEYLAAVDFLWNF